MTTKELLIISVAISKAYGYVYKTDYELFDSSVEWTGYNPSEREEVLTLLERARGILADNGFYF